MKHQNKLLPLIAFILLGSVGTAFTAENAPEAIPKDARFDLNNIQSGSHTLVGRLTLRRQFMGTRANPPYFDLVQFYSFNGDHLKRASITDPALNKRLAKQLANGRSLPAMVTVKFERKRVGHDGINMSNVLIGNIRSCTPVSAESACAAARLAGMDAAVATRYKAALEPGFSKDGIVISIGKIYAHSKPTPRGAALSIHGIRGFNTTAKAVKVEITGLEIEQDGMTQECALSNRSWAPKSWQVDANSWSDGKYVTGEMPRTLWRFDAAKPIKAGKKVKVLLKLKLNGSEPATISQSVDAL